MRTSTICLALALLLAACARPEATDPPAEPASAAEDEPEAAPGERAAGDDPVVDDERADGLDFDAHIAALPARIEAAGLDPSVFTIVVEPPFVVIGDEDPVTVRQRAEGTVRWATQRLKAQYFERDPDHVIDIWLFGTERTYLEGNQALFGEAPGTPFGYYSPSRRALVMNIATGGGTLVHEMVHPFMAANFEACPAWFNEGLASLYEQSGGRGERIVGFTNWRLAGLQEAIEAAAVPPFEALMATSETEFYDEDPGTHYAQARYLLYYLQEHGLLDAYWARFTATAADDPTGVDALKHVLERDDLDVFQDEWETWVAGLSFP